ncbi:hypothetical protein N8Y96_02475 [Saprospiraceae bacterium]|nr:hypothetical protein [Saprospiraceae bacterium]
MKLLRLFFIMILIFLGYPMLGGYIADVTGFKMLGVIIALFAPLIHILYITDKKALV